MSKRISAALFPVLVPALACLAPLSQAMAQEAERWFQIEVSVFSNERQSDRNEELFLADQYELDYPADLRPLRQLLELLLTEAMLAAEVSENASPALQTGIPAEELLPEEPTPQELRQQEIAATGPFPPGGNDYYRFPDFARDAFLQLPISESDFQQTNAAIVRSPEHRLLFHGLWRQPMPDPGGETPVLISAGERYGEHHELEGSLSLHFNAGRDRVVIDADLWLSEFRLGLNTGDWLLPDSPLAMTEIRAPEIATNNYYPVQVFPFQQSRDMRSNEFHYLDHPALGIVVTVFPYELPPLPLDESLTLD